MFCRNCAWNLSPKARFCPRCGSAIEHLQAGSARDQVDETGRARDKRYQQAAWKIVGIPSAVLLLVGIIVTISPNKQKDNPAKEPVAHKTSEGAEPQDTSELISSLPLSSSEATPIRTSTSSEVEKTDGCDKNEQSKWTRYAFEKAVPPDPLDSPVAPLPHLDSKTLLLADDKGEPSTVRGIDFASVDPAICVYSDNSVSVYIPTSVLTARMIALETGRRRPHETFLGLPMPEERFEALTYWNFKRERAGEFAWVERPERFRYEARQTLFDMDKKVVLFSSDILADENGQMIGRVNDSQRTDFGNGHYPTLLRAFGYLADLINRSDRKFEIVWKSLH